VLHSKLDEDDLRVIDETVRQFNGKLFSYQMITDHSSETMDKPTRLPKETYYRLLCLDYLPIRLKRVLYLDCDVLINGSLKELYKTDLTGYLFAAADDTLEAMGVSS
jgi:lipopolysaccharide biosynthesis glycosyltransferase